MHLISIVFILNSLTGSVNTHSNVTLSKFDIKGGIYRLIPACTADGKNKGHCIREKTVNMVTDVITKRAPKYGLKRADYPIILAMIMTESSFTHMLGSYGEVGMLQVIPNEQHIKDIVKNIDCKVTEPLCGKNGKPDIILKGGMLSSYRCRQFIFKNPHYALETGFGEMTYWRNEYNKDLKRIFWTNYPSYYLSKYYGKKYIDNKEHIERWWYTIKNKLQDMTWVVHYNWGRNISLKPRKKYYGHRVLKWYNKIVARHVYAKYEPLKDPAPLVIANPKQGLANNNNPIIEKPATAMKD